MNSLTTRANKTQPASTATTTASTSTSFDTTTKKKFGKNLNKLTAPPAAPVPQEQNKSNSSSKNGFLLLSTKRISSGSNTATASGGILSSKSAQSTTKIPSLTLHTEFSSSTHDALLGVVVGASRLESQQQPDAWGVAEKQQQQQSQNTPGRTEQQQPQVHFTNDTDIIIDAKLHENHVDKRKELVVDIIESNDEEQLQDQEQIIDDNPNCKEFSTSNWDEYGGRDLQNNNEDQLKAETDDVDQKVIMKKLARERAEKRRDEEESRMVEQKERAAKRLKELEEKMATKRKERALSVRPGNESEILKNNNIENISQPTFQLEQLKQKKKESGSDASLKRENRQQRTLYDPNNSSKSYSALVSGSKSTKLETTEKDHEPDVKTPVPPPSSLIQGGVIQSKQGAYSADPESFDRQSIIQLTSYDDRERGDRNSNTTPRMLFDPKSGSMVEVNSREDSSTNPRNRKARVKKNKSTGENQPKNDSIADSSADVKTGRNWKSKKRKNNNPVNQRGQGESVEAVLSTSRSDTRKLITIGPRTIPRSCGVLYSRDKKGCLYCVDGCEGDLGYGVHSVPGGRIKNPKAYLTYTDNQIDTKHETMRFDSTKNGIFLHSKTAENGTEVTLESGFSISKVKEPKHDWIKPNEKIELITGVEDSPTLQATAKEFAPSHTAFALAERENLALSSVESSDSDNGGEDDDDDVAPLGLGFDPALNMDSVIQSPSIHPSDGLEAVDLTTLSLEPALSGPAKNSHIFAFESGATWGANDSEGNNDWGSSTFTNGTSNTGGDPATFLSLSSGSAWGGFGTSLKAENKSPGE